MYSYAVCICSTCKDANPNLLNSYILVYIGIYLYKVYGLRYSGRKSFLSGLGGGISKKPATGHSNTNNDIYRWRLFFI